MPKGVQSMCMVQSSAVEIFKLAVMYLLSSQLHTVKAVHGVIPKTWVPVCFHRYFSIL